MGALSGLAFAPTIANAQLFSLEREAVGLVVDETRDKLLIATVGGEIQRFDLQTQSFLPKVTLGGGIAALAIDPVSGSLYTGQTLPYDVISRRVRGPYGGFDPADPGPPGIIHRIDLDSLSIENITYQRTANEGGIFNLAFGKNGQSFIGTSALSVNTVRLLPSGLAPLRGLDGRSGQITIIAPAPNDNEIRFSSEVLADKGGNFVLVKDNRTVPCSTCGLATSSPRRRTEAYHEYRIFDVDQEAFVTQYSVANTPDLPNLSINRSAIIAPESLIVTADDGSLVFYDFDFSPVRTIENAYVSFGDLTTSSDGETLYLLDAYTQTISGIDIRTGDYIFNVVSRLENISSFGFPNTFLEVDSSEENLFVASQNSLDLINLSTYQPFCDFISPGNGAEIICSQETLRSFRTVFDDVSVTVTPNAKFVRGASTSFDFFGENASLTNEGEVQGSINYSNGNNTLVNRAVIEGNAIRFGAGDDFVLNEEGALIATSISVGDGRNKIVNNGEMRGWIYFSTNPGDDTLINRGELLVNNGSLAFGFGDDFFANEGSGVFTQTIYLGPGDDGAARVGNAIIDKDIFGGEGLDTAYFNQASGRLDASFFHEFEYIDVSAFDQAIIDDDAQISTSFTDLFIREGVTAIETNLMLDVTILENGILGGNGTVTGDITNLGSISPGSSIGTLTINGDLTLSPSSVLEIEFDGSDNDFLIVNGDLQNNGGTLLLTPLSMAPTSITSFEFLNADSISGDFSEITFNGFTGFADVMSDGAGNLSVQITPQIAPSSQGNAGAVAGYLNDLIIEGALAGASEDVLGALFALSSSEAALENALLSLQPEAFALSAAIGVEQSLLMTDLVRNRLSNVSSPKDGRYFWLSGVSNFARYQGDIAGRGTSSSKLNTNGVIGGVEIIRGKTMAGLYGGVLNSEQQLRAQDVETTQDGFVFGAYSAWTKDALETGVSISYTIGEAETKRSLPLLGDLLVSGYDLDTFNAQMQSRYKLPITNFNIAATGGISYIRTNRNRALEVGGATALDVTSETENFVYLDLGTDVSRDIDFPGGGVIRAKGFAGWRYEALGHDVDATANLIGISGMGFEGTAAKFDRSRLIMGGDLVAEIAPGVEAFAAYHGDFGKNYSNNRVSGGITVRF